MLSADLKNPKNHFITNPKLAVETQQNAYVQEILASAKLGRRTFIFMLAGTTLALTACSNLKSPSISSDELALREIALDKQQIISALTQLQTQRPDLELVLQSVLEQSKTHLLAIAELLSTADSPSPSAFPPPTDSLQQLLNSKAISHASTALEISDFAIARIVIQISASESVHAVQLGGV